MAQIKKINIKGVEYDLAGSGRGTTDTAYVDNKTLYIEEGTTAGGGSNDLVIEFSANDDHSEDYILDLISRNFQNLVLATNFISYGDGAWDTIDDSDVFNVGKTFTAEMIENIRNGAYDNIIFKCNGYITGQLSQGVWKLQKKSTYLLDGTQNAIYSCDVNFYGAGFICSLQLLVNCDANVNLYLLAYYYELAINN